MGKHIEYTTNDVMDPEIIESCVVQEVESFKELQSKIKLNIAQLKEKINGWLDSVEAEMNEALQFDQLYKNISNKSTTIMDKYSVRNVITNFT